MELDQTKGEKMYPNTTANVLSEALEALTKVVNGESELSHLESQALRLLQRQAQIVREQIDTTERYGADPLENAQRLNSQLAAYKTDADVIRKRRNEAIQDALDSGLTAYRVAKHLGLTEQAVYKIRDAE